MDRRSFILSASTASAIALMGGGGFTRAAWAQAGTEDAKLAALLDRVFYNFMDTSPEFATMLGLDKGPRAPLRSQLSDYSKAGQARQLATAKGFHAEFGAIDRAALSETSALHHDCASYLTDGIVEGGEKFPYGNNGVGYTPYVISQQDGAYQSVPDFLDSQHPIKDGADADAYLARLSGFATALDQNSESVRADAALGVFAPSFALDTALGQMKALRDQPAAQTVLVTSIARRAKEAGLAGDHAARATLHLGYIDDAPTGPFDGAVCILTLHFLPTAERLRTLQQVHQRLAPGAPFVVAHCSFPQEPAEVRSLWRDREEAYIVASGGTPEMARKRREGVEGSLPVLSPEQDEALLRQAGYSSVTPFYVGFTFRGWVACA